MQLSQEEKRKFIHANVREGDVFITSNFSWTVERAGECLTDLRRNGAKKSAPLITFDNAEFYDELEAGEVKPFKASVFIYQLSELCNEEEKEVANGNA